MSINMLLLPDNGISNDNLTAVTNQSRLSRP